MPRLSVQLIPPSAWQRNIRAIVASETWEELRWRFGARRYAPFSVGLEANRRPVPDRLQCAYCKTEHEELHLHEEWEFDDERRIQRLVGFVPVCPQCHLAAHMGYANAMGRGDEAMIHLAKVNHWALSQAKAHCNHAFKQWGPRILSSYSLDVNYLLKYLPKGKIHLNWLNNPKTWIGSRLDAIAWAQRLLDSDAVILDTETTGLLTKSNVEVIELAAINMKGKLVFHNLFKPKYKIPAEVIKIHRITNNRVKSSPTFLKRWESIKRILNGQIIVTYNAEFDRGVLNRTCKLYKLKNLSARWECAMWANRYFSETGRFSRLPGASHRALNDCRATLRLIRNMACANV